jgi:hypothetical protein
MAEFISQASDSARENRDGKWNVEKESVLELGAGAYENDIGGGRVRAHVMR